MALPKLITYPSNYFMKLPGIFYAVRGLVKDIRDNTNKRKLMILDYGCGICQNLFEIVNNIKSSKGIGIDINKKYIEINEVVRKFNKMNNVSFKLSKNRYKLNFPDNSFDVVLSSHVIEHNKRPDLLIKEIRRLLKPDGILILSTPYKYNRKIWSLANFFGFNEMSSDHVVEGYTKEKLESLLKDFEIENFRYCEKFLIRITSDIATLATFIIKRRLKLKKQEASIYEKILKVNELSFNKSIKYSLFYFIGLIFIIPYEIDNILSKIYPLKGYGLTVVAKVQK